MITVRFPNGFSVQYNDLDNADFRANGVYLGRKSKPDVYSVWVPNTCIIEHIHPCRTYQAAGPSDDFVASVNQLSKKVAALARKIDKKEKV